MTDVTTMQIDGRANLDRITVYWHNYSPGNGMVTIVCYGMAWNAWFGAMSDRTIQQFFADADTGYLVTKLGIAQFLKESKGHHTYLARIINAIKDCLRIANSEETFVAAQP